MGNGPLSRDKERAARRLNVAVGKADLEWAAREIAGWTEKDIVFWAYRYTQTARFLANEFKRRRAAPSQPQPSSGHSGDQRAKVSSPRRSPESSISPSVRAVPTPGTPSTGETRST